MKIKIDPNWRHYGYFFSDKRNPVGIKVKFKQSKSGREIVEKSSSDFSIQMSVNPNAFLGLAVKDVYEILEEQFLNHYELREFNDSDRKLVESELLKIISEQSVPDIFKIFTRPSRFDLTDKLKEFGFTGFIEIPRQNQRGHYENYINFINKLNFLGYITL